MSQKDFVQAYIIYTNALRTNTNPEYTMKYLLCKAEACYKLNLKREYEMYVDEALKIDIEN